jgi:hypothetical protein
MNRDSDIRSRRTHAGIMEAACSAQVRPSTQLIPKCYIRRAETEVAIKIHVCSIHVAPKLIKNSYGVGNLAVASYVDPLLLPVDFGFAFGAQRGYESRLLGQIARGIREPCLERDR